MRYDFNELAAAAAAFWAKALHPQHPRPAGFADALIARIMATSTAQPTEAIYLCSRPEAYRTPEYEGVNALAIVAYQSGLQLRDFQSALIRLFPERAPELLLHPAGQVRPLLDKYQIENNASMIADPPGEIAYDADNQEIVIKINPEYTKLSDYQYAIISG